MKRSRSSALPARTPSSTSSSPGGRSRPENKIGELHIGAREIAWCRPVALRRGMTPPDSEFGHAFAAMFAFEMRDQIDERAASADRRKLARIADENQAGGNGQRINKGR